MSKLEMRQHIEKLNRLNLDRVGYEIIKSNIEKMFDGIRIIAGTTSSHELFFRARKKTNEKISLISELIAPPPDKVTGFQRCNSPGQPVFYCSSRRVSALLECNAKTGDIFYLSQWIGNTQLPVNKIFDEKENIELLNHISDKEILFHSYMNTMFTRRVHSSFSNDYKITSAISEQLMNKFKKDEKKKIEEDGKIGLRYPSVADIENSYNTAFPPDFAVNRIDLLHVMEIEITDHHENQLQASLLNTAIDFDDEKIIWSNNTGSLPAPRPKEGGVLFEVVNGKWRVLTTERFSLPNEAINPLLNELLNE